MSQKWTANGLVVPPSTISREIKRNGARGGCVVAETKVKAIAKAVARRSAASRSPQRMVHEMVEPSFRIRSTTFPLSTNSLNYLSASK